ncbi:MAG: hypothetical protein H8D22_08700 [Candidatus Cloacimonetes bacterium]|nr:hypothetical protein [Candidatus Cloacimonadota bacterium]
MEIEIKKFNDVWLDNGLSTFVKILESIKEDDEDEEIIDEFIINSYEFHYRISDKPEFIKSLSNAIESKIQNLIVSVEDKKTGEKKEIKKDYILIQEKKKIGGKVALKEDIFDANKTEEIISSVYKNLDEGNKICFFCGRKFKSNIKKLQQASYPFVTKIKSLSGIRSGKEIKLTEYVSDICPHCYLLGVLEWLDDSLIYRSIPTKKNIIILPQMNNIDELIKLKKSYNGILNNEKRWSNIKIDIDRNDVENPPGKYSTLISFYENLIRNIQPDKKANHWFIIEIPAGSVKNPKYFEIRFDELILNLFYELILKQKCLFYREFVKVFYAFYNDPKKGIRDFDREQILHEQLCQAITENNFNLFCNAFLPGKGVHIGIPKDAFDILEKIIKIWRIRKMNIENKEDYLKTLQMASQSIANLIGTRISLFFKLEKSKTPSGFLAALQEITRRNIIDSESEIGKVYKSSIEKIAELIIQKYDDKDGKQFFYDTKNIILIYASLRRKIESKKEEKTNE